VIPILIPPLRERRDDILLLASEFLREFSHEKGKEVADFSPEVVEIMMGHHWPGNVRELENVIEHAVILAKNDRVVPRDLPQYLLQRQGAPQEVESLQEFEKSLILKTLKENNWNKHQTAKKLKINRSTLYGKMRRYGITEA